MTDLVRKLEIATKELRTVDATMNRHWHALWLTLGRAMQAAETGDLAETKRWLFAAGAHEFNLTSRSSVLGPIIEALGFDDEWDEDTPVVPQPPSTQYSSRPPASSAISTHRLRKRG